MSNIWLVVTKRGETAALADILNCSSSEVSVLVLGSKELAEEAACTTGKVTWIDTGDTPAENYAPTVAEVLMGQGNPVMVGYATPGVRAAFGIAATKLNACVISNVVSVMQESGNVTVEHTIVDDKIIESLTMPVPACLLVNTLTFQPVDQDESAPKAEIEQVQAKAVPSIELVEVNPIPPSGVEMADYVVGVGRGIGSKELFDKAKELADVMGAEISGTMPGVRDFGYFDEDASYIGLSGVPLNSELYITLGISGSTPHIVGLLNAKTVVCVNNDLNAQMFDHSDYGILGDAKEVIPELIKAFS